MRPYGGFTSGMPCTVSGIGGAFGFSGFGAWPRMNRMSDTSPPGTRPRSEMPVLVKM